MLDPKPVFQTTGLPSGARVNLLHQKKDHRYVGHILYAPVIQRGSVKIIEDFPILSGIRVNLRVSERISSVEMIPSGEVVQFKQTLDSVEVEVPAFAMHTAVVFSYES
jgi:hypothetical protein